MIAIKIISSLKLKLTIYNLKFFHLLQNLIIPVNFHYLIIINYFNHFFNFFIKIFFLFFY